MLIRVWFEDGYRVAVLAGDYGETPPLLPVPWTGWRLWDLTKYSGHPTGADSSAVGAMNRPLRRLRRPWDIVFHLFICITWSLRLNRKGGLWFHKKMGNTSSIRQKDAIINSSRFIGPWLLSPGQGEGSGKGCHYFSRNKSNWTDHQLHMGLAMRLLDHAEN